VGRGIPNQDDRKLDLPPPPLPLPLISLSALLTLARAVDAQASMQLQKNSPYKTWKRAPVTGNEMPRIVAHRCVLEVSVGKHIESPHRPGQVEHIRGQNRLNRSKQWQVSARA
jgi:hypothetical protein